MYSPFPIGARLPFPAKANAADKVIFLSHQKFNFTDNPRNFYFVFFSWYAPYVLDQVKLFLWDRTVFCCNSIEEQEFV